MKSHDIDVHGSVVSHIKQLGYKGSDQGLCVGITHLWIQAVLSGKEENFYKRLQLISETINLKNKLTEIKTKIKKNKTLTEAEQKLNELLPFLEGIELAQQSSEYKEWYGGQHVAPRHTETVAALIAPDAIQELGGITKLYSEPGIYNENELKQYLEDLSKILTTSNRDDLAIALTSDDHRMGLRYNAKSNQWILVDPNMTLGDKPLQPLVLDPSEIAAVIMQRFTRGMTMFDLSLYTTHVPANSSDAIKTNDRLKEELERFQQSHVSAITAEITKRSVSGNSLATFAIRTGDTPLLKKLVAVGETFNQHFEKNSTMVHLVAAYGSEEIVAIVATQLKDKMNEKDDDGRNAAHYAAQFGNSKVISALKEKGVDLSAIDQKGKNPLHLAVQFGYESAEMIKVLKENGVDLTKKEGSGLQPIQIAIVNKNVNAITALKENGIDLTEKNSQGQTLAHYAAHHGNGEVIVVLRENGVDLTVPDNQGRTPIDIAIQYGNIDALRPLLQGIDLNRADKLIDAAIKFTNRNQTDVIDALIALRGKEKFPGGKISNIFN